MLLLDTLNKKVIWTYTFSLWFMHLLAQACLFLRKIIQVDMTSNILTTTSRHAGTGFLVGTIMLTLRWRRCYKSPEQLEELKKQWIYYLLKYPVFFGSFNLLNGLSYKIIKSSLISNATNHNFQNIVSSILFGLNGFICQYYISPIFNWNWSLYLLIRSNFSLIKYILPSKIIKQIQAKHVHFFTLGALPYMLGYFNKYSHKSFINIICNILDESQSRYFNMYGCHKAGTLPPCYRVVHKQLSFQASNQNDVKTINRHNTAAAAVGNSAGVTQHARHKFGKLSHFWQMTLLYFGSKFAKFHSQNRDSCMLSFVIDLWYRIACAIKFYIKFYAITTVIASFQDIKKLFRLLAKLLFPLSFGNDFKFVEYFQKILKLLYKLLIIRYGTQVIRSTLYFSISVHLCSRVCCLTRWIITQYYYYLDKSGSRFFNSNDKNSIRESCIHNNNSMLWCILTGIIGFSTIQFESQSKRTDIVLFCGWKLIEQSILILANIETSERDKYHPTLGNNLFGSTLFAMAAMITMYVYLNNPKALKSLERAVMSNIRSL